MFCAAGAYDITPWSYTESEYQFWTNSNIPDYDSAILKQFYEFRYLISIPIHMPNAIHTFWNSFSRALNNNKKTLDGKRRILSIIADDFTYNKLEENLGVSHHTISEAQKYAKSYGHGALPLVKPIIHRAKLTKEQLNQFELFFADKANVNMSSYRTEISTGLPILYLQNHKKALWEKFHEKYLNGMQCTSFMTHLQDYAIKLTVNPLGHAVHDPCISHCLRHTFGDCNLVHPEIYENCEKLFILFDEIKTNTPTNIHEILNEYQTKLVYFQAHHAQKTYFNAQLSTDLTQLSSDDALIIVDYKMKILCQKSRETKTEFFGKREWSLHSLIHAIKRWVKMGHDIELGKEIQEAIKDLAGTHVANIIPNHETNSKLRTIHRISNWHEWTWPDEREEAGYILARSLLRLGSWNKYTPKKIIKVTKDHIFKKPEPMLSEHIEPTKSWTIPIPHVQ
ncbi:2642_t:CDS:2, partial [Scutellospora calospora]